jgi:hypothetical protein
MLAGGSLEAARTPVNVPTVEFARKFTEFQANLKENAARFFTAPARATQVSRKVRSLA